MNKEKLNAHLDSIKRLMIANKIKLLIITVYLILALAGLLLSRGVKINYNLSDYLAEDTETSIALEIMKDEFGMTGNIQVMLSNIDKETANEVKKELSSIEGVLTVSFDAESETSYKNSTALFNILVDGEDHSDTAAYVISEVKSRLGEKYGTVELGGSTIEYNALRENTGKEMGFIIVFSILLAALILLLTASSWLEPIILLCSGLAIAINMGLNLFLGEISYITNSVSSILQLALSVDYSIALIHAYRSEKKTEPDSTTAMRRAVKMVLNPVSASALTTIAGLFALLFMSFTIGFDIGIVLIKGIVVSAVCAMTLLPAVVLIFDPVLEKTKKRPFIPKGEIFTNIAFKYNRKIVPIVGVLIIAASVLQIFNSYGFTDSIGTNQSIVNAFGRNDAIVVVYERSDDIDSDSEKELLLKSLLEKYEKDGKQPLASFTAYSTTVADMYTVDKASNMLGLPSEDVKMLFTMYNLYENAEGLKMTGSEFINYTNELIASDLDASDMVSDEMRKTIELISTIEELMSGSHTSSELYLLIQSISESSTISRIAIDQIYGLKYYDETYGEGKEDHPELVAKDVFFFAVDKANDPETKSFFKDNRLQLELLKTIYEDYQSFPEFEPFITYMNSSFTYSDLIDGLNEALNELKGLPLVGSILPSSVEISDDLTKQLYIMYLDENGAIPDEAMAGREFVDYLLDASEKNSVIDSQLSSEVKSNLYDLKTADAFLSAEDASTYIGMAKKLEELQGSVTSVGTGSSASEEMISGVYIKRAISLGDENPLLTSIKANDLLEFVKSNMQTNALLSSRMDEAAMAKVEEADELIHSAEGLFFGKDKYARVLVSVVIPAEGDEMVEFIDYMLESVSTSFGGGAHITGKVVSTYDLQAAFDVDNMVITVFTILSILLVILFVFRSLSLPIALVLVIQGAIWISLSFSLIGGDLIFFMSYIVTNCILMGATVDYGILMSNNYIVYRKTMDKRDALSKAVDSAMPTVFTSGIILIICGVIISLISSQNSIASVGTLLARGTLTSIVMITVGLPSILYLLDKFILKYTMSDKQSAYYEEKIKARIKDILSSVMKLKLLKQSAKGSDPEDSSNTSEK